MSYIILLICKNKIITAINSENRDYIFIQDIISISENVYFSFTVGLFNIIILIYAHFFKYGFMIFSSELRWETFVKELDEKTSLRCLNHFAQEIQNIPLIFH